MESNYWARLTSSRLSRRRAMVATGAGALGAAFLAACGGSDSGGGGEEKPSGTKSALLHEPVVSTNQAKTGGTLKHFFTADLLHADALASNSSSTVNQISVFAYPRLLKFTVVEHPKTNGGDQVEGELAQTFETSPDKLTVTMKLRPGLKWDTRAPTNGRVIDSSDVAFSWKKFGQVNASAVNLVYDNVKAPGAAVENVTTPDANTVVMKLKAPDAALYTLLAGWDQFYVMPKESESAFDPKTTVRGHGPWMLEEYRPSAFINWVKNPEYYNKGRPFYDRLEMPLVTEQAARIAQFKAGNIMTDVLQNSQQDVVQMKRDVPAALILQAPTFSPVSSPNLIFGYEGDSLFKDERYRQALSMAIDREAFADAIENRPAFEKDGLPVEVAFNTVLSAGWPGYWMDPKDTKLFGDSAKFLSYNIPEAKKLLSAAGKPNGAEFDFFFNRENTYGAAYARQVEIYGAMFNDIGMKARMNGFPYAQWLAQYHYGYLPQSFAKGEVKGFNGIGLAAERTRYTPAISLYGLMHPEGDAFHGATPDGRDAVKGDPKLTADLAKLRQETDRDKAISLTRDVIRYATQHAVYVPKPSTAKFFTVWSPAIGNLGAHNSSTVGANIWGETRINWWIDATKLRS